MFSKLVIFGVGLIGGSLARALRKAGCQGELIGVGRTLASITRAAVLGVIDRAITLDDEASLINALIHADWVVLAAPVAQTHALLARIAPYLQRHTIVTDAGSTKVSVVRAARSALGDKIGQFVPAHPIAGRELHGVDAALHDLYAGRNVVLCPLTENSPDALARVAELWRTVGAQVHIMTAEQHDRVFASVSHLPHLLAFALMEQLLSADDAALKLTFAGSSFRDFTRIAASSPEMWRDICLANRTMLLADLDAYIAVLGTLRAALDQSDSTTLERVFTRAAQVGQP